MGVSVSCVQSAEKKEMFSKELKHAEQKEQEVERLRKSDVRLPLLPPPFSTWVGWVRCAGPSSPLPGRLCEVLRLLLSPPCMSVSRVRCACLAFSPHPPPCR